MKEKEAVEYFNTGIIHCLNTSRTADFQESLSKELQWEKKLREECVKELHRLDRYKHCRLSSSEYKGERYYTVINGVYDYSSRTIRGYIGKRKGETAKIIDDLIYYRYLDECVHRTDNNIPQMEQLMKMIQPLDPISISQDWGRSYMPLSEQCYKISGSPDFDQWKNEFVVEHRVNKPKYPQDLRHQAEHNLLVRSKSEVIICNQLIQNKLAFIYEPDLKLGKYTVSPDFLVLSEKKNRLFIWEHMGMLDDSKYMKNALWKLQHYQDEGIVLGQNLIVTYDDPDTGINSAEINEIIRKHFVREKYQGKEQVVKTVQ